MVGGTLRPLNAVSVPETYWVPLVMVNWSITVHQHLLKQTPVHRSKAWQDQREFAKEYLWWLILCCQSIAQAAKDIPEGHTELPIFHELLFRIHSNLTEKGVMAESDHIRANSAQTNILQVLFDVHVGFIGESLKPVPFKLVGLNHSPRSGVV